MTGQPSPPALGPGAPPGPGRAALAVGVEEERAVHAAARRVELPVPDVRVGAGQSTDVGHLDQLLVLTVVVPRGPRFWSPRHRSPPRARAAGSSPCVPAVARRATVIRPYDRRSRRYKT